MEGLLRQFDPILWPTLRMIGVLFAGGAVLILILGRFNLRRIAQGELGARYLGWLLLTPIYLVALFTNYIIGSALLMMGMIAALYEYTEAARLRPRDRYFLYIFAFITLLVVNFRPEVFALLPVLVLFVLTVVPILRNSPDHLHGRARIVSWGYIYTVWPLAHFSLMLNLPGGRDAIVVLVIGTALSDVGAYVVGKAIGRRLIAPAISPTKAWEGLLGDLLGAAIAVGLFLFLLPGLVWWQLIGLVLIIGLGSAWGDIISSMAKRSANIKDWGSLVPGHGGMLDRLNSLLVVLPLTYYYLVLVL